MDIFWKHIFPKTSVRYFHRITTKEYDEDDVHEYVYKFMTTQGEEAHKQLSITFHMEINMEKEVTLDPETPKNELAEMSPILNLRTKCWRQVMRL